LKSNWLDKAITWVSPRWGLQRTRARKASDILERFAYEGARVDRRTAGWRTTGTSANAEIGPALNVLRQRSRDLIRNNGYASNAIRELTSQCIGTGITAQAKTQNNAAVSQQINDAWRRWVDECDADGQLDFYGLQRLAVRSVFESGEALVRVRPRLMKDGLYVPFQLQVIESDYLDHTKTEELKNGGRIIQGVEFDPLGRRVAYWLYRDHPGDALVNHYGQNARSYPVPAEYMLHLYDKERPQQVRGVPIFSPVIIAMRDMDEYREAELVRKKIEACFATFITVPEGSEGAGFGQTKPANDGTVQEEMSPGMMSRLRPGEDVKFATPSGHGEGYRDFMRDAQTGIATGVGTTYEQFTGDLSAVNYSSYKAGENSFRSKMDQFRWLCLVPMFLRPCRAWFINYAYAAGRIDAREFGTEWSMPKFRSVDPEKDARAAIMKIRSLLMTPQQAVGEEGYEFDEQASDYKKALDTLDRLGLIADFDSRKRTAQGNPVTEPQGVATE
jgi:lambda family phage portal protein